MNGKRKPLRAQRASGRRYNTSAATLREVRMHNIQIVGILTAVAVTAIATAKPSTAAVIYPWCANYSGRGMGGSQNCGFVSFSQCLATVRGVGGTCGSNPFYQPYPPPPSYAPPIRRRY